MGLMTGTVFEALTDSIYRRMALVVDQVPNMLQDCTLIGLAGYIDEATEDPALQAALLTNAADVDRAALMANRRETIQNLIGGSNVWKDLLTDLFSYVRTANGGSYASVRAYCVDQSAAMHPLVGELARSLLGEGSLSSSGVTVGVMPPKMQAVDFDRVFTGTQGSLTDDTTDAGSATEADVALFAADSDVLVLGSKSKFSYVLFDLDTVASSDCALLAYYWNGTAWAALTIADSSTGFSVNDGLISFTAPADWEPCHQDMQGTPANFSDTGLEDLYYIILQRTEDTVATPPVASMLQVVPEAVTLANGSDLYGVDQPPLAIVQITDTNECEVTVIQQPDDRFEWPGTGNSELILRAITDFGDNITFTLGYTDQDGTAATKAQTAWTTPETGATKVLALDTGDTGIRTITAATCAITTAATAGIFLIELADYSRAIRAL